MRRYCWRWTVRGWPVKASRSLRVKLNDPPKEPWLVSFRGSVGRVLILGDKILIVGGVYLFCHLVVVRSGAARYATCRTVLYPYVFRTVLCTVLRSIVVYVPCHVLSFVSYVARCVECVIYRIMHCNNTVSRIAFHIVWRASCTVLCAVWRILLRTSWRVLISYRISRI